MQCQITKIQMSKHPKQNDKITKKRCQIVKPMSILQNWLVKLQNKCQIAKPMSNCKIDLSNCKNQCQMTKTNVKLKNQCQIAKSINVNQCQITKTNAKLQNKCQITMALHKPQLRVQHYTNHSYVVFFCFFFLLLWIIQLLTSTTWCWRINKLLRKTNSSIRHPTLWQGKVNVSVG